MSNLSGRHRERNSNLELLRIISMILIVMSHSDDFMGLYTAYASNVCPNKLIMNLLHLGGQVGVGCFVLISGYFMVEQQFKFRRILQLWGEVIFYTGSIFILFLIWQASQGTLALSEILQYGISSFFPVLTATYWFVSAYLILMALAPFFNKFINTVSQATYQKFLVVLIVIYSVLAGGFPLFLPDLVGGRLGPVFIMYFIAGYIRRYVDCSRHNGQKHLRTAVIGYALLYASVVLIDLVGVLLDSRRVIGLDFFYRPLNSPLVILVSVELFLGFLKRAPKTNQRINTLAGTTFGIYLIHENPIVSKRLLPVLFPVYRIDNFLLLLLCSVCVVFLVYAVCTCLDLLRQKTVERVWIRFLDARYSSMEQKLLAFGSRLCTAVTGFLRRYYA